MTVVRKNQNILFAGRSVFHFTYYESLIKALCDRGHHVEVLFDEKWSNSQPDEALKIFCTHKYKEFSWRWSARRTGLMRNQLFGLRELYSYSSYLQRPEQSDFYLNRWRNYLPPSVRKIVAKPLANLLLASGLASKLFSIFESLYPASPEIIADICKSKPDLIIASPGNMRFDEEIEYIKAGKALGIPTAILVLSWDNLTTKGLFHIKPDLLLCWNQAHADEATAVHGIDPDRVLQIGSTFFDKWFDADRLMLGRKTFCERVGLDPERPFFLYLGSSSNIAHDESWLAEEVYEAMRKHPDPVLASAQLLVRPHPANAKNYSRLEGSEGLAIWPKTGTLPESDEAQSDFINSVRHAVAAMGINTSGMMDNIILGRPCIALMTERYVKTQDKAVHFGHLYKSGSLEIARDGASCADLLSGLLDGHDEKGGVRDAFVQQFFRPYGLAHSAGKLGAMALESLAQKKQWSQQVKESFLSKIKGAV